MKKRQGNGETGETRQRILNAAEKEFAAKGFDGARVDGIARAAKVNKALIYYYFKSKDAILEELLQGMVTEAMALMGEVVPEDFTPESHGAPESMEMLLEPLFVFLRKRANLIKIVLMESLKSTSRNHIFFRIIDAMLQKGNEFFQKLGMQMPNQDDRAYQFVGEFFTGMVPLATFFSMEKNVSRYLEIPREELWVLFRRAYMQSHGHYTLEGMKRG